MMQAPAQLHTLCYSRSNFPPQVCVTHVQREHRLGMKPSQVRGGMCCCGFHAGEGTAEGGSQHSSGAKGGKVQKLDLQSPQLCCRYGKK